MFVIEWLTVVFYGADHRKFRRHKNEVKISLQVRTIRCKPNSSNLNSFFKVYDIQLMQSHSFASSNQYVVSLIRCNLNIHNLRLESKQGIYVCFAGPFQPSPDLMLRFYGLYKQATEGKNNQPKPSFWAVITKAKWDAWKCLGNMPKEEAMKKYVDELKQVFLHQITNFFIELVKNMCILFSLW